MHVTPEDLNAVLELYHEALHRKEFSSLIVEILRNENSILLKHIEPIRQSFDPLESQCVVATAILFAIETENLIAAVDNKAPSRIMPTISEENILGAAHYVGKHGIDYGLDYVTSKLGLPIVQQIKTTGLDEITRIGMFRSGKKIPNDCISFASLFFIYHTVRGAVTRERKQRVADSGRSPSNSQGDHKGLQGFVGREEDGSDIGLIRDT